MASAMHADPRHPVLLVHPEAGEAEYLRRQLLAEGVAHPIVILADTSAAQDYLEAVLIAHVPDHRYLPCVVLLDDRLGQTELRSFARWLRDHVELAALRITVLASSGSPESTGAEDPWRTGETVATGNEPHTLAGLIARSCE